MDVFHLHCCDLELNPVSYYCPISVITEKGEQLCVCLSVWLLWSMTDVLWYMAQGLSCGVALSFGTFSFHFCFVLINIPFYRFPIC